LSIPDRFSNTELLIVYADQEHIVQVTINLLINAFRYSTRVDKLLVSVQPINNKGVFAVQNFGFGITPGKRGDIFENFIP